MIGEARSADPLILADTSAWIEYVRDTGSAVCERVDLLLQTDALCATEPVLMELLAGARTEREVRKLRMLLGRCAWYALDHAVDYEDAATLYRSCRRGGDTIRSMIDCLVAAVAIRTGASVLHRDRDYDVLARHTLLHVEAA